MRHEAVAISATRTAPIGRRGSQAARALLLMGALLLPPAGVRAAPDSVALPGERTYPENVAAGPDGTLYVSSFVEGGVIRVAPGADTGEVWIKPGAYGTRSTFGLLPDPSTNTLWLCSNDLSFLGIPGPGEAKGSALKAFDLKTGEGRLSAAFPGSGPSICNDMALGPDGSVYVTSTLSPQILRLKPGAGALEVWLNDPVFDAGPKGAGLDGIAFGADGQLYVNTFTKGELFRVAVKDGAPGPVTRLRTSRPLVSADGMRLTADGSFLLAEGGGSLSRVTVDGDAARIETLREGFEGGATGVAQAGDTAWVSVGQLPLVLDPAKKGTRPALPFKLYAVPLAKR